MSTIHHSEVWQADASGRPTLRHSLTLPVKTVSESNMREHWGARAKRVRVQRQLIGWGCSAVLQPYRHAFQSKTTTGLVYVHLTRIAPRSLDDDNLRGALKGSRDAVTDALGLKDDSDPRLRWEYSQARGKPCEYAVRVEVWRVT